MKWILKAIIQKIISWLPASQKINFLFQKYVTKGVRLSDQYFSDKYTSVVDHLTYYKKYKGQEDFKVLELGSGWYPVVPIALFLSGAKEIVSFDISPLMNKEGVILTIEKYLNWHKSGKLKSLEPFIVESRLNELENIDLKNITAEKLLASIHLSLKVKDARTTEEASDSFDLICSNNTFEHIYPEILEPILVEFQRILKRGGLMSHFIDMSDHFAHLDKSINIYNFLRYSKKQWSWIDNTVQPQNRWRLKDYLLLYRKNRIKVIHQDLRLGNTKEVESVPVHADFSIYGLEDLAVSHAYLVSSK